MLKEAKQFQSTRYDAMHTHLGHALQVGKDRKFAIHADACYSVRASIFHPIALVVETLGAGVSLLGRLLPASVDCRDNVWVCHTCS